MCHLSQPEVTHSTVLQAIFSFGKKVVFYFGLFAILYVFFELLELLEDELELEEALALLSISSYSNLFAVARTSSSKFS